MKIHLKYPADGQPEALRMMPMGRAGQDVRPFEVKAIGDTEWLPVPRVGEHVLTDAIRRRVNNVVYDLDTRTVVVEAA